MLRNAVVGRIYFLKNNPIPKPILVSRSVMPFKARKVVSPGLSVAARQFWILELQENVAQNILRMIFSAGRAHFQKSTLSGGRF